MFDQDSIDADPEQLDASEFIAFFRQAGLAVGRSQEGDVTRDAQEGHGQRPNDGSQ